jgi:hypothetical protein
MHHIVVLDHGDVAESLYDGTEARRASLTYCKTVIRRRTAHVRWTEDDPLPGLPEKVLAERFGDPCEGVCCVPLADEWPEQPTVTNS